MRIVLITCRVPTGPKPFAANARQISGHERFDYWEKSVFLSHCIFSSVCFLSPQNFAVDEMGNRIDDLEKSIGELMTQAGIEEGGEGAVEK